jgi:RNA polymerase sigma-70 factor (ECF subfamily)
MIARRPPAKTWLRAVPAAGGRTDGAGAALAAERVAAPTEPVPDPALRDEALIAAVASGDSRAAAGLYDRLVGVVDRALFRVFGRRESNHDDLIQATFEQIVITLTRRRFAGACSLSSWACHIATHVGLNALRARRRERRVLGLVEDTDTLLVVAACGPSTEDQAGTRREMDRVRNHLASMSPEKAETILLHEVFGYELAEISVLTGASVSAVQSRLVRGRKELQLKLSHDGAAKASPPPLHSIGEGSHGH